jgi:hypothetical protein
MKFVLSILVIMVMMMASAQAQTGGGHHKSSGQQKAEKSATPKADDKAYNAALRSLPNKPYDPWSGTR